MSDKRVVVKASDMAEDMIQDATEIAQEALKSNEIEKDVAAHIKREFDKKHGTVWHCVVGRSFGSYVTHETKHFIYFYVGQLAVLLFKTG